VRLALDHPHALPDESRWYVLKIAGAVRPARCRLAQGPFVWEVGAGKLPLRPGPRTGRARWSAHPERKTHD
jgi:hypothetical protein